MAQPCVSCGEDKDAPPKGGDMTTRCMRGNAHKRGPAQVWVWLGTKWELRGTGAIVPEEKKRKR